MRVPILHAIVLGVTQGLTEFLPVSSSGHLILVPWLFGWEDLSDDLNKRFDVALHMGTFLGVVVYFRKDIWQLFRAGVASTVRRRIETDREREAWLLLLSSIPAAVTGALFESTINDELGQEWLIAVMLIVFGIALLIADRAPGERTAPEFRLRDALFLGTAQALALQPGVSRSGITMTAARVRKFTRDSAARLSFLMSIPIIGGAGLYSTIQLVQDGGIPADFRGAFFWGTVASAVTGFAAVWVTLRYVRTKTFMPFVIYRVLLGFGVLSLLTTGFR